MKANNKFSIALLTILLFCNNAFSQNSTANLLETRVALLDSLQKIECKLLLEESVLKELDFESFNKIEPIAKDNSSTLDERVRLLSEESILRPLDFSNQDVSISESTIGDVKNVRDRQADNFYVDTTHSLNISNGLALKGKQAEFADDLSFVLLNNNGQNLFIDYGFQVAQRYNVKQTPNSYALTVGESGINIVGFDVEGTRRGIEELKKLLSSSLVKKGSFPFLVLSSN